MSSLSSLLKFRWWTILVLAALLFMGAQGRVDAFSQSDSFTIAQQGWNLEELDAELPDNLPRVGITDYTDPKAAVETVLFKYIITPIFLLAGGVAVIILFYSAFRLIIARGEEEGITAMKKSLTWAFVGLLLIIFSYTLVRNLAEVILQILTGKS